MMRNAKRGCVGDVFLAMTAYLKLYTQYVQNFNAAATTLQELKMQSPGLCKLLATCSASERAKNMDINSFLIMPVQRIPRYALLLSNLLKYTREDHPDHQALSEAVTKVKDVANYVNEKKKEAENIQKVLNVGLQFQNKLDVVRYRREQEACYRWVE
jgi:RhoGEF domain